MMDFSQDQEVLEAFIEETGERLNELESGILRLEQQRGDVGVELLNSIFRAAHSVKAGAGLLKLRSIEKLAHWLENILGKVRTGEVDVDGDLITALLEGVDSLRALTESVPECAENDVTQELLALRDALDVARARMANH